MLLNLIKSISGIILIYICASASAVEAFSAYCSTGETVMVFDDQKDGNGIIYMEYDHSDLRWLKCEIHSPQSKDTPVSLTCKGEYEAWNDDIKRNETIYLSFSSQEGESLLHYSHEIDDIREEEETSKCSIIET